MECQVMQVDLVGYYFGTLDEGHRCSAENHLCQCPNCMKAFILLKRNVEVMPQGSTAPSQKTKLALPNLAGTEF